MSDYISKDSLKNDIIANLPQGRIKAVYLELVDSQPTLDEKEIIRKSMEQILTRLEEEVTLERMDKMEDRVGKRQTTGFGLGVNASIEIVKEEGGIE